MTANLVEDALVEQGILIPPKDGIGAEAIDISKEQDVFGIVREPLDEFFFIGHEFIIYLLFNALKDEKNAFQNETWNLTEGLAEYYLKKISGSSGIFNIDQKYVEVYEKCEGNEKRLAAELYRMGLQAFDMDML